MIIRAHWPPGRPARQNKRSIKLSNDAPSRERGRVGWYQQVPAPPVICRKHGGERGGRRWTLEEAGRRYRTVMGGREAAGRRQGGGRNTVIAACDAAGHVMRIL
eukprot:764298-Hanusia_phi.AAC.4